MIIFTETIKYIGCEITKVVILIPINYAFTARGGTNEKFAKYFDNVKNSCDPSFGSTYMDWNG